jgi:hypothetical protein
MSCPNGFETTKNNQCVVKCPSGFKFLEEGDILRCVHNTDNQYYVTLTPLSVGASSSEFEEEKESVDTKIKNVLQVAFRNLQAENIENVAKHSRIQGEYAKFNTSSDTEESIQEVLNTLKPFRPHTAPESDIQIQRRHILSSSSAPNMLLIQVSLVILLLCVLAYAFIPAYAGVLSILLISVGISLGIFLWK